jgi:hypothetical protein
MSSRFPNGSPHLDHCIAEMRAEIEAALAADTAVRALAQLEARNAAGEPLTVVCGTTLKAALQGKVAANPMTIALRKIGELELVLSGEALRIAEEPAAAGPHVVAIAPAREAKAQAVRRVSPMRAAGRKMAAASLAAMCWVASVRYVTPTGMGATFDLSFDTLSRTLPIRHALLIETR